MLRRKDSPSFGFRSTYGVCTEYAIPNDDMSLFYNLSVSMTAVLVLYGRESQLMWWTEYWASPEYTDHASTNLTCDDSFDGPDFVTTNISPTLLCQPFHPFWYPSHLSLAAYFVHDHLAKVPTGLMTLVTSPLQTPTSSICMMTVPVWCAENTHDLVVGNMQEAGWVRYVGWSAITFGNRNRGVESVRGTDRRAIDAEAARENNGRIVPLDHQFSYSVPPSPVLKAPFVHLHF
ncbi:hypothetical protein SODALDRAFT_376143 [Sodiomyces alkalinus F11]|uniref:Uncharacterized protein n=1 Tax=Sodiomyces alkalinus (strain CBS 110278 / VKM F-3762 / F11) TaxID=1314773 RepID=A0A3N2Q156_SODAK|nr:hypothetical protein SODALDRAFT_376143 [Sodiomyces alkalinus F11]ROT40355.1 hypothetical protein SODALDRAFT_376143 [Sodiomyces alkalinus F11]